MAEEMVETEYLLPSPANAQHLLKSIENVNKGEGLAPLDSNTVGSDKEKKIEVGDTFFQLR